ncbi:MAG TPA: ABC-F family ATP-binding cassette domain-containing protein [Acidimicrobiales bacterium]|nr:ABC-F family ATP-binding cassette domain-containing protein [Acidimicrobiales bacterium]
MSVLVDLQRVSAKEPDRYLFQDLSLTISDGDRLGVVGINGTGKSTLLRVIAGRVEPDQGVIHRSRSSRVEFLEQRPDLGDGTVGSLVGGGWQSAAALDRLGATSLLERRVRDLSGGQAKRVALAQTLTQPSELLILDEPTNHLDLAGVAWLERWLDDYHGALVIVSHDRHLLDHVTNRMLELDRGSGYLHDGGYASYLESRSLRDEQAANAESSRRNLAREELAWLRRGAKARSRKPQARVDAAKRLIAHREPEAARPSDLDLGVAMHRLGDTVLELTDVAVAYGEAPPVLHGVNLLIGPGDRLGVLGANGTGKSTLLHVLAGRQAPTSGTVTTGRTVVIGYYDQHGETLDLDARVQDIVAGPHRTPGSLEDVALMKRFWFTGNLPFTRVGELSGGERRRLQLLAVLAAQPNVLLLDEPTNDLDLDTLRVLEDFLDDWPGTLVVVSHDRAFLERTIDATLAIDGDGELRKVAGGVTSWVASQMAPPASANAQATKVPTRTPDRTADIALGRQLRDLDKAMARLGQRRASLHEALLATSDHLELARLGGELGAVQSQLSEAEEQWLELAEHLEGTD